MMGKQSRRGALLGCLSIFLLPFLLFLNACGVGAWNMSNTQQKLTVVGTIDSIQAGGSRTITPGLIDGAGNYLSINDVVLSHGAYAIVNNGASPPTLQVFNPFQEAAISSVFYQVSHLHSIQSQYPTPTATTIGADTAPSVDIASGIFEASSSATQAVAGGASTLVTLPSSASSGTMSTLASLAGNIVTIAQTSVARSFEITGMVSVASTLSEAVRINLVSNPSGATVTLASAIQNSGAAGGTANFYVQALVTIPAAAAASARTFGLFVSGAGGDLTVGVGGGAKGVSLMIRSL